MANLHSNLQTLFVWIVVLGAGASIIGLFRAGRVTQAVMVIAATAVAAAFVFADVAQVRALGQSTWTMVTGLLNGKV